MKAHTQELPVWSVGWMGGWMGAAWILLIVLNWVLPGESEFFGPGWLLWVFAGMWWGSPVLGFVTAWFWLRRGRR